MPCFCIKFYAVRISSEYKFCSVTLRDREFIRQLIYPVCLQILSGCAATKCYAVRIINNLWYFNFERLPVVAFNRTVNFSVYISVKIYAATYSAGIYDEFIRFCIYIAMVVYKSQIIFVIPQGISQKR